MSRVEQWLKNPRYASAWMFVMAVGESLRCLGFLVKGFPVEANVAIPFVLFMHSLIVLTDSKNCLIISAESLRRLDVVVLAWLLPIFLSSLGRVL